MRDPRADSPRLLRRCMRTTFLTLWMCVLLAPVVASGQEPLSEEIQRNREEMERRKRAYLEEKAKIDDINTRVQRYRELRETIPFSSVSGTSNLVQVYINRHSVREIAQELYFLTDGATSTGFLRDYWPLFLQLNRSDEYDGGLPLYGRLEADRADANVAIFPNIRKRGLTAVVAEITPEDSLAAMALTKPVVDAYKRRLQEEVEALVLEVGSPPNATGPARLSGETRLALFQRVYEETRDVLPPRRITDETRLAAIRAEERTDVDIHGPISLEPAPPAWSLRRGVNMLGEDYQGYNLAYQPGNFQLQPEAGAMAFLGGRSPDGNAATQPGIYFSFNQRLYRFFLINETAFAAFSASDAPAVNGGSLNVGVDLDIGMFNVAGMFGLAAFNVVGETESSLAITGKARFPLSERLYVGAIYMTSDATVFRGESSTGIVDAGFVGLNLTIR